MSRFLTVLFLVTACIVSGCKESKRKTLSGTATYEGKPIPYGIIVFSPADPKKDPDLVEGHAEIVNGRYQTLSDSGPASGEYLARISAYDGVSTYNAETQQGDPYGKLIFSEVDITLTVTNSEEKNIDITAEMTKKVPPKKK